MTSLHYAPYHDIHAAISSLLLKNGATDFVSTSVASGLCDTSLRGVDSHGVRLFPHYLRCLQQGRINGQPRFQVHSKYSSFLNLDADNTFGHAAGFHAIDSACAQAELSGISICTVFNSSHPGAMASYGYRAAEKGFASFGFTHADSLIQSHLGKTKFFGTNPICFCAPREDEDPFCVDMAPSYIPWNKILNSMELGQSLSDDVAVDASGSVTHDPTQASALLPIAGHKGFALAAMVEVLCSCLTGMRFGPHIPGMYSTPLSQARRLGQVYIVFRIDGAVSADLFLSSLHALGSELRSSSLPDSVLVPNDPQILTATQRLHTGIPLTPDLFTLLFP